MNMALKRIGPGNRMSAAVIHGNKVYLAGYVAEAAAGKSVGEQTADILAQIDETLKEAGTDKTKIIKANIWLTDIKTFAEMNAAWDAWVVRARPRRAPRSNRSSRHRASMSRSWSRQRSTDQRRSCQPYQM
jgi:enamine deaminase RidA (YjgF/YER057c/UK114 family)